MKRIFITNVKRFPTEYKTESGHDNVMTCTRWTFSNGVSVSIMRCIFRYSATNESKVITKQLLPRSESSAQSCAESRVADLRVGVGY